MVVVEMVAAAGSVVVAVSVLLAWLYLSSQETVSREAHVVRWIAVRAGLVGVALFYVCCKSIGLSVLASFGIVVATPVVMLFACHAGPAVDTPLTGVLLMPLTLPCFGIAILVLGPAVFQTLYPPIEPGPPAESKELVSNEGVVVSTLRPMGDVEIDGQRFSAKSMSGGMVAVGTRVLVRDRSANVLLVSVVEDGLSHADP